ncbi:MULTISPECIES: S8 family serine peptidase [unclassified Bacillus (in: firmicutes)]|uniref:S8 family peptidase n=1 Tax=unclassified Bacillus (in: firmicutes) TaxID=185979 RepID=UPI001BEB7564|nr:MULTISPECIES: S8 family serine peptidase [unclassified Bacillus (in: firmicutes)]MBT2616759.1 S8 family serine peptidase [Bacillus sp. ISL-78]MBT2631477.1 S8 family serine peptidase [Bacillus sp. ISL-101]MBT2718147.1 S8 family serine peptidase [Bacillus sp. ISL-57]
MHKLIQAILPVLLLFMILPIYQPDAASAEETPQSDGVIVKYKEANDEPINELIEKVEVPKGESTDNLIEELEEQKDVEYAEPNYLFKKMESPNDPAYIDQWHHKKLGTGAAWTKTMGSKELIVAIIDDGIDRNHEDLKGRIVNAYDTIRNRKHIVPKGEHGTHIAGIIAGSANNGIGGTGIAPNVKLMPINVFDGEYADTADIIEAIHYAVQQKANIINMSLGDTSYSESLNKAVQEAYKKGVLIVAAAGNEGDMGKNVQRVYPAAFSHVISVAATNSSDKRPSYSNYHSTVDIAAPGDDILSTLPNGKYGWMSGTSMATPMVAGVAALIWSNEPKLNKTEVEYRLYDSAVDLGTKGKDIYYGNGRVNAKKALEMKTLTKPSVTAISDKDTKINGKIPADFKAGTVSIYTDKKQLATVKISGEKTFTATIAKQTAGTTISTRLIDKSGNKSIPVSFKVADKTAPVRPSVNTVGDNTVKVTGKAEASSSVTVKTGRTVLGKANSNSAGNFTVTMSKKQKAGKVLSITATDKAGNISSIKTVTVADKTAPSKPTVNTVTTKTTIVTGKAEANSTVSIKASKKVIGSATATTKGTFSVRIPKQKAGKNLYIHAKDKAKNVSESRKVTVKK